MEDFELLRREKRRRKAKLKFFGLDVPNYPDFNKEGWPIYPSRLIKSTWGDDYDIALYGRLGLYCYNFQKGTNFKFVRWEKYCVISTADVHFYVTLDAREPASDSVFSFQTLLCEDYSPNFLVRWNTLACRIKCKNKSPTFVVRVFTDKCLISSACIYHWEFWFNLREQTIMENYFKGCGRVDEHWDDTAVDDFYKGAVPKWFSDEELASDNKKYYVVQESELLENDWLHLFTEIAFYSKTKNVLTATPPLEIEKVVVETTEDTEEGHEKLKAHNAIFYVSYKYNGEYSEWARDHKAVIRKTMDGKPGHMYLEVVAAE